MARVNGALLLVVGIPTEVKRDSGGSGSRADEGNRFFTVLSYKSAQKSVYLFHKSERT